MQMQDYKRHIPVVMRTRHLITAAKFGILKAVTMENVVLRDVTSCSLVDVY
jgi:hypothetical protein